MCLWELKRGVSMVCFVCAVERQDLVSRMVRHGNLILCTEHLEHSVFEYFCEFFLVLVLKIKRKRQVRRWRAYVNRSEIYRREDRRSAMCRSNRRNMNRKDIYIGRGKWKEVVPADDEQLMCRQDMSEKRNHRGRGESVVISVSRPDRWRV